MTINIGNNDAMVIWLQFVLLSKQLIDKYIKIHVVHGGRNYVMCYLFD